MACVWNFAKIIFGCILILHNYVSEFLKKTFSRSVESWHAYPAVVKSNFLLRYAPDCTFSSRKMKKLPIVGGGHPPPPARSLRSLAKIVPPNCLAHYATDYSCTYIAGYTGANCETGTLIGVARIFERGESDRAGGGCGRGFLQSRFETRMLLRCNYLHGFILTHFQRHW